MVASRPLHAPLDCDLFARRFGIRLPPWRDALERALG
jgi:dTDP-4-dehydrorhamnose reductase